MCEQQQFRLLIAKKWLAIALGILLSLFACIKGMVYTFYMGDRKCHTSYYLQIKSFLIDSQVATKEYKTLNTKLHTALQASLHVLSDKTLVQAGGYKIHNYTIS